MKKETMFEVPGKPLGKQRPRVCRNGITFTPKQTTNYENFVKEIYSINKCPMFDGYVAAKIMAYYPIPKSTTKKNRELMLQDEIRPDKKPDTDNIAKIILDSLNGIAYADDKQVVELTVTKIYSKIPYVRVELEEV